MSQFACFILCIVIVGTNSAHAEGSDEADSSDEYYMLKEECVKKFEITQDDLDAAVKSGDVSKIDPCYWGCHFKKLGLLNDKGQYNLDNYVTNLKKFLKDKDEIAALEDMGKQCASVKDTAVSDGEAGCEMGALLAACVLVYDEKTE
nr:odorant-binding protein 29 [Peridroma saucia]